MRNNNEEYIIENNDAEEFFQESYDEAQKIIHKRGKVEKLLKRLERKLQGLPKLGDALAYIPKMGLLVTSWFKGEYTEIPLGALVSIIGVLVYFVSPIDAIPDIIPGVGLLDDAGVVAGALYLIKNDLDEYMNWRRENGLDADEDYVDAEAVLE